MALLLVCCAPNRVRGTAEPGECEQRDDSGMALGSPAAQTPYNSTLTDPEIRIVKKARRLYLYEKGELLRSYPIGLGFDPVTDKERQGDGRTPEGVFHVRVKNSSSQFHLSLGLDYPNYEDASRGFVDDLIDFPEYVQIINAINDAAMPPQETLLGGEIYIHGNGADSDWTKGCIALEDADIEELFSLIPLGTRVRITQ